ncbi:UNVERIFIED_CONTAM: hypothetical protein PYX00_000008 [Menopon gallinae]|uniref:PiggyBac transposable element-derived protein domain-containing protein n=1 Tax=Menopon gallinae TaxID=328185 RepID=A0AAW2I7C4_9NEOP
MVHFVNNEKANFEDRLYKIKPIIDKLRDNYRKYYDPPETLCIDESIIPFRGRVLFRQYIKNKRHRYGVKLFKLCLKPGYTYNFEIYCGRQPGKEKTIPKAVNFERSSAKKKLQRGEIFAKENENGITLMKWKDKRDVLLLSTKHSIETAIVRRKGDDFVKPKLVIDYNEAKCSVDLSDQMTAYSSPLPTFASFSYMSTNFVIMLQKLHAT